MTAKQKQKKKWARTPVLKAGTYTAYDVLQHVYTLVKAEPKRLNMETWLAMFKGNVWERSIPENQLPSCGTVACLAGWINVSVKTQDFSSFSATPALHALFGSFADETGEYRDLSTLFWSTHLSRTQARAHLKHYLTTYETALRAYSVVVPKSRVR